MRVDGNSLSDCVDDAKENAHRNLCGFLGGILDFFNSADIYIEDEKIGFAYEDDIDPFEAKSFPLIKDKLKKHRQMGRSMQDKIHGQG